MLNAIELLVQSRALVAVGWCQGTSARDAKGRVTPFGGKDAVCFCMSGAMCHLMNFIYEPHRRATAAVKKVVGLQIAAWNDKFERTQEEVLAAYDAAIAILKQEELDKLALVE